MKKIFLSVLIALTMVALPLNATAQTTLPIPGNGYGNNINQLTELVALLEQLLDLQERLAELQGGGDGLGTVGESAGEGTGGESVSTTTEAYYLGAVTACTNARLANAKELFTVKNNFADFTIATLNLPYLSLQAKGDRITDRQGPVSKEAYAIEGKKPGIDANCNKTISPLADVASTSPAVRSAIALIDTEVTALEQERTIAAAVPTCTAPPLSPSTFDLKGLKKSAVAEKCNVKLEHLSAQAAAKTKAKLMLERI